VATPDEDIVALWILWLGEALGYQFAGITAVFDHDGIQFGCGFNLAEELKCSKSIKYLNDRSWALHRHPIVMGPKFVTQRGLSMRMTSP
jgi:hypothetical protein